MANLVPSLPVRDVTRTVDFYRHVLGFEMIGATGKGSMTRARVKLGDVELLFRSARSSGVDQAFRAHEAEDRLIFHLKVDDVFALYNRAKGRAVIIRDLETTLFGLGEFAVEDVDGVILAFSQPHQSSHSLRVPPEQSEQGQL